MPKVCEKAEKSVAFAREVTIVELLDRLGLLSKWSENRKVTVVGFLDEFDAEFGEPVAGSVDVGHDHSDMAEPSRFRVARVVFQVRVILWTPVAAKVKLVKTI